MGESLLQIVGERGAEALQAVLRPVGRGGREPRLHQRRLELGLQFVAQQPLELRIAADAETGDEAQDGRRADARARGELRHRLERSEEHTSELQSLMRISYAVFCLKKKKQKKTTTTN